MTERQYIEPILQPSLDEFKAHIRVTSHDLDVVLDGNLKAAIEAAEAFIGKTIARSRFTLSAPFRPSLRLKTPVMEVESVEVDGVPATDWTLAGGSLTFGEGVEGKTVRVVYQAGMVSVPYDIKAAILLHAAALFNNPVDSVETLTKASTNLLRPHRAWGCDAE